MGRPKKIKTNNTQEVTPTEQINNSKVVPEQNSGTASAQKAQNFTYTGKAKLTVKFGNKTLFSTETHNNGTDRLFYGLVNALIGNYTTADSYRPNALALLSKSSGSTPEYKAVSGLVLVDSKDLEDLSDRSASTHKYRARLHFNIPYSSLILDSSASETIDALGLYAIQQTTSLDTDYLAKVDLNDAIQLSSLTANTSLAIEWLLGFENQSV